MRTDGSAPIALLSTSDSATAVQLRLTGCSPLGREDVKLQWQVAPLGTPFTATNVISGASAEWTDTLTTGVVITHNVTGPTPDTPHYWRAHLVYRPGYRLAQSAGRWIHIPWNGWTEQDLRTITSTAGAGDLVTTTVTYAYDPLYRLPWAAYSSGEVFTYTYDAVGNRLWYTETGTLVHWYEYDDANRLTNVDDQAYTWDNNGNLLSDGTRTFILRQTQDRHTTPLTGWCRWSAARSPPPLPTLR